MDGKDGAGVRRDCSLHQRRIDAEGVRLDIHENGLRAGEQDRIGRGDECEWNGDDFVAGADSVREETATACATPHQRANSSSNCATTGPCASWPLSSTRMTARFSSSPISGWADRKSTRLNSSHE